MNSTKEKISAKSFSKYILFILFSSFFGGLAFLGRINTRAYTKLLPQYQTVQKCAVPTKPIFHHLEQFKVKFWGGVGSHKHPGWCLPLLRPKYKNRGFVHTVWLKSVTIFSGGLHILHHYDSNFAHLLAFKTLVIEFFNAKR